MTHADVYGSFSLSNGVCAPFLSLAAIWNRPLGKTARLISAYIKMANHGNLSGYIEIMNITIRIFFSYVRDLKIVFYSTHLFRHFYVFQYPVFFLKNGQIRAHFFLVFLHPNFCSPIIISSHNRRRNLRLQIVIHIFHRVFNVVLSLVSQGLSGFGILFSDFSIGFFTFFAESQIVYITPFLNFITHRIYEKKTFFNILSAVVSDSAFLFIIFPLYPLLRSRSGPSPPAYRRDIRSSPGIRSSLRCLRSI